jgi:predicted TIM-barrel fold metal-dependent hydrolase
MRIIDAHTHVQPQHVDLAVEVMDRAGIACSVTLAWHDGFGATLRRQLEAFARHPGRWVVFGNVDWRRINERGFADAAARQLERDVAAGLRGLKVYKALGLEYRHADGALWQVNDPALDPIWQAAGELGIPVLIHTADPAPFWEPVDERSFWSGVLRGEYARWSYYRTGLPGRDELVGERNQLIARHPRTTFICPHVGSRSDCLDTAAEDLDALPNLYYDLSARLPTLARSPRRAAHAREFLCAYAERILFGTDMIYDDAAVATGMQAQCLYQPDALPLGGADARTRYADTSVAFVRSHLECLTTDVAQPEPPFCRSLAGYTLHGLALPPEVCQRILWGNAAGLLGVG